MHRKALLKDGDACEKNDKWEIFMVTLDMAHVDSHHDAVDFAYSPQSNDWGYLYYFASKPWRHVATIKYPRNEWKYCQVNDIIWACVII